MLPLKLIVSEKQALLYGFSTYIYGVTKEMGWKTFILRVNLDM